MNYRQGQDKEYPLNQVFKMSYELEAYPAEVYPGEIDNVQVLSSANPERARNEARELMQIASRPFFLAEVVDVSPQRKWNRKVACLKMSMIRDGDFMPGVTEILLSRPKLFEQSGEDESDIRFENIAPNRN